MLKKLLVAGVMMTLVLTVFAGVAVQSASADAQMCATVNALAAAGLIAPDKLAVAQTAAGCGATTAAASFTRNLTVGSTGADVTALQNVLGVSPATGYFGSITKAAVMAYQTANGLPSTGYVGPLTLAKLNASAVTTTTTTTTTCPAGMTCTPVAAACPAGMVCTPASAAVSTTGVEGSITVTQSNTGLPSTVYEGDSKVGVLAIKVEAKNSDVSVQRVKVDLSTSTQIYNKVLNKIYVMDGSTVLASSDLNADTVVKESDNQYTITLTGINLVVAKDTTKTLTIAVDVKDTVDTSYRSPRFYPIRLYSTNAVRAVDGAGLDQYSGTNAITKNLIISSALVESATLAISTDSSNPDAAAIIASEGTGNNEIDGVTLLKFAMQAKKDTVKVTDLTIAANKVSGAATLQTVYLYDGSTQLDSGSLSAGVVAFSNLDISVAKDTTKVLTVKADVRDAAGTATSWSATTTASYVTAENSVGDTVSPTGSATGNAMSITNAGPEFALISKSVGTKSTVSNTSAGTATSTQDYNFKIRVTAVGGPVIIGASASGTPTFSSATATGVNAYKGSVVDSLGTGASLAIASYFAPSSGVTTGSNGDFTIAEGQSADFDVTYSLTIPTAHQGSWSIGIKGLSVGGTNVNFMDGLSAWRSSGVQLP